MFYTLLLSKVSFILSAVHRSGGGVGFDCVPIAIGWAKFN